MPNAKTKRRKPSVAIIGIGRLGQALAIALHSRGYPIHALVARSQQKAEKTAALITENKARPRALTATQLRELPEVDLIIIATPDDAIEATAGNLARFSRNQKRSTVLHTSGALSSEVLAPLAKAKFQTGSLHPLVSISEPVAGAAALRGAFYCLEGTTSATRMGKQIVRDLGGTCFSIKPKMKALYHAAAVMSSPHVTALFSLATEMLAACGLSKRDAQKVLVPLLESTINNLKVSNAQQALTGTFARGDIETVRRHLHAMSGKEFAGALEVYKLLGLRSLQLAEKNRLDPRLLEQMRKLLH